MEHTMGHTIELQLGIPWSYNWVYRGATMGHAMEQQWGIQWSNNRHTMEHAIK